MSNDSPNSDEKSVVPLRDDLRYMVIEGVIGAGKTSLARLLAKRFNAQLILEEFEENPFLDRFYTNRRRWAFHTQLSFLASRFRQQKALFDRDLFHNVVISDYMFEKDRIFAHQNLEGDELQLYETLFWQMNHGVPRPDLMVYLQSNTDRLMKNINERDRSFERQISRAYINELNEAYNAHFFHFDRCPLLIINAVHIDFVNNPEDLEELIVQIASTRHPGTTYFNPERTETERL